MPGRHQDSPCEINTKQAGLTCSTAADLSVRGDQHQDDRLEAGSDGSSPLAACLC